MPINKHPACTPVIALKLVAEVLVILKSCLWDCSASFDERLLPCKLLLWPFWPRALWQQPSNDLSFTLRKVPLQFPVLPACPNPCFAAFKAFVTKGEAPLDVKVDTPVATVPLEFYLDEEGDEDSGRERRSIPTSFNISDTIPANTRDSTIVGPARDLITVGSPSYSSLLDVYTVVSQQLFSFRSRGIAFDCSVHFVRHHSISRSLT
jgi:hypothetical protein